MAKIGKSTAQGSSQVAGSKLETKKRSGKLGSVDFQSSFVTSTQNFDSFHQRKKSAYGAVNSGALSTNLTNN